MYLARTAHNYFMYNEQILPAATSWICIIIMMIVISLWIQ